ncbi:hypothetical protein ACGFY3_17715 [Streptomyces mirabilis]|uniref:hypothetical protein n=1 Tax=Streptomyces mirabilis TaxID=68239 RepID=UPI00371CBC4F
MLTFLEFLLESREVLDRAFRFARPKTRAEILAKPRGWNISVDPSWEDPPREGEQRQSNMVHVL